LAARPTDWAVDGVEDHALPDPHVSSRASFAWSELHDERPTDWAVDGVEDQTLPDPQTNRKNDAEQKEEQPQKDASSTASVAWWELNRERKVEKKSQDDSQLAEKETQLQMDMRLDMIQLNELSDADLERYPADSEVCLRRQCAVFAMKKVTEQQEEDERRAGKNRCQRRLQEQAIKVPASVLGRAQAEQRQQPVTTQEAHSDSHLGNCVPGHRLAQQQQQQPPPPQQQHANWFSPSVDSSLKNLEQMASDYFERIKSAYCCNPESRA